MKSREAQRVCAWLTEADLGLGGEGGEQGPGNVVQGPEKKPWFIGLLDVG